MTPTLLAAAWDFALHRCLLSRQRYSIPSHALLPDAQAVQYIVAQYTVQYLVPCACDPFPLVRTILPTTFASCVANMERVKSLIPHDLLMQAYYGFRQDHCKSS